MVEADELLLKPWAAAEPSRAIKATAYLEAIVVLERKNKNTEASDVLVAGRPGCWLLELMRTRIESGGDHSLYLSHPQTTTGPGTSSNKINKQEYPVSHRGAEHPLGTGLQIHFARAPMVRRSCSPQERQFYRPLCSLGGADREATMTV